LEQNTESSLDTWVRSETYYPSFYYQPICFSLQRINLLAYLLKYDAQEVILPQPEQTQNFVSRLSANVQKGAQEFHG